MIVTRLALRRPLTVYLLIAIVVFAGIASYRALPKESYPEIKVPLIMVSVIYPGASPVDVESQISRKIETELKGVSGVKEIRSTSFDGYALLEVEFNPDVDLDTALQKVRAQVDLAEPELPEDAEDPVITDVDYSRIPILIVSLAGEFGMARLKSIADDLKDDLEAVQGVNLVNVVGGQDREVHVFADPRRLTAFHLGLGDLVETIQREHVSLPGGEIDVGRQSFLVRLDAEVDVPSEIEEFVVDSGEGRPVKVRDVATVVYGFVEEETRARLNGRTAISLMVEKRTGANIIEVSKLAKEVLDRTRESLPASAELKIVMDQSVDTEEMVTTLENNILSGLLLVLIVLFLFLGFRPAAIVSAAIPLSMLITFLVVLLLGYTLNMVILFSLVLVLGMLVDNAIVTVENIYRHREIGDSPMEAAGRGAGEVAMPIIASTATTLCAFAPMLFWPGTMGEFMKYLPLTLIIGLSASLFVALVFNPTLAMALFHQAPKSTRTAGIPGPMTTRYRKILTWCLDPGPKNVPWKAARNWILLGTLLGCLAVIFMFALTGMLLEIAIPANVFLVLALIGGIAFALQGILWLVSLVMIPFGRRTLITDHRARVLYTVALILAGTVVGYGAMNLGSEFFPDVAPREVWVDLEFPSGTNLETQDALVLELEQRLLDTPDLKDRIANVGSTGFSFDPASSGGGSHESRINLQLERFHDRSQDSFITMAGVREKVSGLTGVRVVVDKPEEGPRTGKPVSVRLIGDDYSALGHAAESLRSGMERISGLLNVDDDFDRGLPELRVHVDRDAASRAGTDTREIALAIRTALAGTEVAKYRVGEDEYDIRVRLPREDRRSADPLEELTVPDEDGLPLPLRSLARIDASSGPASIKRVDLHRTITVEADVDHDAGYTDPDRREAVAGLIEEIGLPEGIIWEFAGSNEEEEESRAFLSRAFVIALMLISLILVTEFDSLVTPITILVSVVLSLIGVLWGLMITGTPFGIIMTGIGVISLAGIVVNNAIVLCDFILQERRRGKTRRDAILEAGTVRLRPVLLTAVTTVLGLIPLTVGINIDFFKLEISIGSESTQWWGPMGVAVIFGLSVATMLTLLVVPVTYDVLDRLREKLGI